jgi:hypothetical protein
LFKPFSELKLQVALDAALSGKRQAGMLEQ